MGRSVALAIALAACSPTAPNNPDGQGSSSSVDASIDSDDGARSGSRLKLSWYEFTDGTRQWAGLYDAQNKEYCQLDYYPWTDGKYYCLPVPGGELVYTDSTCQTKALRYYVDSVCPQDPAKYYLEYGTVGCTSRPATLYLRGAKLAAPTYRYKNSDGTCGAPLTAQAYDAIYAFGQAVPNSELVQVMPSAPEGTNRLAPRYLESSDGMRFPYLLHDSMLDMDCYTEYQGATDSRCVPLDARSAYYAHDSACAQPELALANTCNPSEFAYTFPPSSCPDESETYYSVTGTTTSSPLYYPSGGTCVSTTASAGYAYYALGSQITPAPMTYAADNGAVHRVQLIHNTTADGTRFRDPNALYDSQLATQCTPQRLPDGTIRCIPSGQYISTYYTSSACTTPLDIVEVYKGPSSCSAPSVPKFGLKSVTPDPGTCTYGTEVHPVMAAHVGAVYYGSPGSCFVYTPFEATLYDVGAAIDLTSLVSAAIATDGN